MTAFLIANMAPIMFASLVIMLLLGYPAAFSLGAVGLIFAFVGIRARRVPAGLPASASRARLRRDEQRHAARDPVLYVHGIGAGAVRHGRGPARHHRAVVRHHPRRPRLRRRVRRRPARGDDRRRRRFRDLDGPDLAADHAALWLRPPDGDRHHRGLRHVGANHSAFAGSDRDGRPARQVGRRHVRRRLHPGHRARGPVCRICLSRDIDLPEGGSGAAGGGHWLPRKGRQPRPAFARRAHAGQRASSAGS